MAYRTWGRVLLAALGVALLAGAGQLGFAYGLGIVRFARDFEAVPSQWTAQLAWVAWFAMTAAIVGALAADRLARNEGYTAGTGSRIAYAVAAGIGAAAVAPLTMLPAQDATVPGVDPVMIAGLTAALGAVGGIFAALGVLAVRTLGWNIAAITELVWLLALISVAPSLGPDDPLPEVRLGVLDPAWLSDSTSQRLAVIIMPALAVIAGAGVGVLAKWRNHPVIPVAASGAVGPAMLALAYLIAGPGSGDRYQTAPYWGAIIAVGAGALGSVLAAVAQQLGAQGGDLFRRSTPAHGHRDHTAEVFPAYGRDRDPDADVPPWERHDRFGDDLDDTAVGRPLDDDREPWTASGPPAPPRPPGAAGPHYTADGPAFWDDDDEHDSSRRRDGGISTPSEAGRRDDPLTGPFGGRDPLDVSRPPSGGAAPIIGTAAVRGPRAGDLSDDPLSGGFGRAASGPADRDAGGLPSAGRDPGGLGAAGRDPGGLPSAGRDRDTADTDRLGGGRPGDRPDNDPLGGFGRAGGLGAGGPERDTRATADLTADTDRIPGTARGGRPDDPLSGAFGAGDDSSQARDLGDSPPARAFGLGDRPGDDPRTQQRGPLGSATADGPIAGRRPGSPAPDPLFAAPPPPTRPEARPGRPTPPPPPQPAPAHQPAPPITPPPSIAPPVIAPRGGGDWRSDRTDTFPAQRDDLPARDLPAGDLPARDQPARDLPARDQPARDLPARDEPPARERRDEPPRFDGPPRPVGGDDMPDWRLAGPAWTPPDDDGDDDYVPPRDVPEPPIPAQREKKRGLFGRKRAAKAEPPPPPPPAAPAPPPASAPILRDEPVSPPAPSVAEVRPTSPSAAPQQETRGRGKKAKRDEEYVDWVAGLSAPEPEERPRDTAPRRSLRSGPRHSTDTE
jgi:hypothetical protein